MPPIPTELGQLSPTLAAFIKHFPVDRDALAVAAGVSQASTPDRIPIAAILEKLSVSNMRSLLARMAENGEPSVMSELNRLTYPRMQLPIGERMSCVDFAAKAIETRERRKNEETKTTTAQRQREAELRKLHLTAIFQRADSI